MACPSACAAHATSSSTTYERPFRSYCGSVPDHPSAALTEKARSRSPARGFSLVNRLSPVSTDAAGWWPQPEGNDGKQKANSRAEDGAARCCPQVRARRADGTDGGEGRHRTPLTCHRSHRISGSAWRITRRARPSRRRSNAQGGDRRGSARAENRQTAARVSWQTPAADPLPHV